MSKCGYLQHSYVIEVSDTVVPTTAIQPHALSRHIRARNILGCESGGHILRMNTTWTNETETFQKP